MHSKDREESRAGSGSGRVGGSVKDATYRGRTPEIESARVH